MNIADMLIKIVKDLKNITEDIRWLIEMSEIALNQAIIIGSVSKKVFPENSIFHTKLNEIKKRFGVE